MKSQYKFNPEEMNFKELDNRFRVRFWRVIAYIFAALFTAFLLNIFFIILFDSPRERMVRSENEELIRQYNILQDRKTTVDTVFKEIHRTDENIFRLIFETEPTEVNLGEFSVTPYTMLKEYSDRQIVMATSDRLDSLLEDTRTQKLEYDILRIKAEDKSEILPHIPAVQPIENHDLTRTASGYGYRIHPIYKIRKFHQGMDYTAPVGTQVYATGAGKVESARRSRRGSGNRIVIDHGYGFKSVYAHLNEIYVQEGRSVSRGDIIGTVGNTGLSAGPHLHYEVLFNDEPVNPVNFYFLELSPKMYNKMIGLSKNSGQSFD
ncbi:MAG: peptidoglycan DD-metalloendopeptidase family protein [Bacteroidales bacterium]